MIQPRSQSNTSVDYFAASRAQHARARQTLARGVATAFRAGQLPVPISFDRGVGARIWDIDGNEYVDYALAFGPLLLGHSPAEVVDAVALQLTRALGFGASHRLEAEASELVVSLVPSAELCAFNTTGSEAVHSALRIARAATGRSKVVKFLGHYHGWYDTIHVGVPPARDGRSGTGGQDERAAASIQVLPWNNIDALSEVVSKSDVAAVIMEPIAVNGGCLMPAPGYLEAVRELTRAHGTVLIFDEVITGFRVALGGAQEYLGVKPDLTVLGKALGAGFPISAVCGRADVMEVVAGGSVAHVGTFNLNPVCAAATIATLTYLQQNATPAYTDLDRHARMLATILENAGANSGLPLQVNVAPGIAHVFVADEPVHTYEDTLDRTDPGRFRAFAGALTESGVHVIPKGLMYVSTAHDDADLEETRKRVQTAAGLLSTEDHG